MKVIHHDGADERHAIVALVCDKQVLSAVAATLERDAFGSRVANVVAGWCLDYWDSYSDAPGPSGLMAMFDAWKDGVSGDLMELVHKYIMELPDISNLNSDYAVDLIGKIVQRNAVQKLGKQIAALTEDGKHQQALEVLEGWKKPTIVKDADGVFPLSDLSVVEHAFETTKKEPLVKFNGHLGEFFGDTLAQDSFVAFLAPEKTGKTTVLQDVAWRAVEQGRRVALFSLGDMSQDQMLVRLIPRLCKRPMRGGAFSIPKQLEFTDKEPRVDYERYSSPPITKEDAIKAFEKHKGDHPDRFRLLTYSAGSMSAFDISAMVRKWADAGWVPEVIVLDYADILAWPKKIKEEQIAINENWQELRALSTDMRCLVVTATQSDAPGYNKWLLDMSNFSRSKTKMAHVTGMVGLNMTQMERRANVCRYNWVCIRESDHLDGKPNCVGVAGCIRVGRPSIISQWVN